MPLDGLEVLVVMVVVLELQDHLVEDHQVEMVDKVLLQDNYQQRVRFQQEELEVKLSHAPLVIIGCLKV